MVPPSAFVPVVLELVQVWSTHARPAWQSARRVQLSPCPPSVVGAAPAAPPVPVLPPALVLPPEPEGPPSRALVPGVSQVPSTHASPLLQSAVRVHDSPLPLGVPPLL